MKVLIVSNEEASRQWVRTALGPDATFREVDNGNDALRRAQTGGFDLVIADETTIPFGAFGLSRELKVLPEPPAVLILLERAQDAWLAKWSGADRWLLRPIDPFELAEASRALVAERAGPAPAPASGDVEPVAG